MGGALFLASSASRRAFGWWHLVAGVFIVLPAFDSEILLPALPVGLHPREQ